jgi:hypothetical protein
VRADGIYHETHEFICRKKAQKAQKNLPRMDADEHGFKGLEARKRIAQGKRAQREPPWVNHPNNFPSPGGAAENLTPFIS